MTIQPKTALITGASRGLGRSLALELVRRGYGVALVARGRPELIEVAHAAREAAECKDAREAQEERESAATRHPGGGPVVMIAADVGDKNQIHPITAQALDALGSIGVLINNASDLGAVPLRPLQDTECETFERVLQVNLLGPFRLTKALLPQMRLRGSGIVVNITSDAAVQAYAGWGAYGASKAALSHLTAIWREELKGTGIQFHAIDPGEMDTRMHRDAIPNADPATLLKPADVAARILAELELP